MEIGAGQEPIVQFKLLRMQFGVVKRELGRGDLFFACTASGLGISEYEGR